MIIESILMETGYIYLISTFISLEPSSYLMRICFGGMAFGAAMSSDKVFARLIGFVWLLFTGGGFFNGGSYKWSNCGYFNRCACFLRSGLFMVV